MDDPAMPLTADINENTRIAGHQHFAAPDLVRHVPAHQQNAEMPQAMPRVSWRAFRHPRRGSKVRSHRGVR